MIIGFAQQRCFHWYQAQPTLLIYSYHLAYTYSTNTFVSTLKYIVLVSCMCSEGKYTEYTQVRILFGGSVSWLGRLLLLAPSY